MNGYTITKVSNLQKLNSLPDKQDLAKAGQTAIKSKMSAAGIKSPKSATQSPSTTPTHTLDSCDTNNDVCLTTAITSANETDQVITKPASQTDKDTISPEVILTTTTSSTSTPTITKCDNDSNVVLSPAVNCLNKNVEKKQREATAEDVDEVARLFEEKPEAFEKWLTERAPPEAICRLHEFIESRKQPMKRLSVTSDLFQQWMSSSPIQSEPNSSHLLFDSRSHLMDLDEGELFMELIRDVANELDIDVLCHKILVNVGLLTHADRGSLFLAKGPPNNRYLVAKLFDVTQKTHTYVILFTF